MRTETELLNDLEVITKELGGTMTKLTRADSLGRSSKVIEIEYEINTGSNSPDTRSNASHQEGWHCQLERY